MYCITLEGSARVPVVINELQYSGLLNSTTVLSFERNVEDGKRGCFTSHQEACRRGLQENVDAIVIFEDDVVFRHGGDLHALIEEAKTIAAERPSSLVALGCLLMAPMGQRIDNHPRFAYAKWACTHSYVVSREMARKIVALEYKNEHIDVVMKARYGDCMIACVPGVAFQRPFYTRADLTLTENTYYYRTLVAGRNLLTPTVVQVVFEYFFRALGNVWGMWNK